MFLVLPGSARALTSCPLSTEVYPYAEQSLRSYEVQITDGGPGDVDSVVDGVCLFRTRVCLGSAAATPEPCDEARIVGFSAKIRSRLDRSVRDATVRSAVGEVSRLFDGPETRGNAVHLETAPLAGGSCVDVPVRLPADGSRGPQGKVRLAYTASVLTPDGATVGHTSTLRLKCNPRPPSGRVRTRCRTDGRDCTDGTASSTTTTDWFETAARKFKTTTSLPPSTTTTSAPPPPTTTTSLPPPPTTTTSLPPPSTTSTTAPPPTTTTTSIPLPTTTTSSLPPSTTTTTSAPLPPTTTTSSAPPPSTTSTTGPPPSTTSTTEPEPTTTSTTEPPPPTTSTTDPPPSTTSTSAPPPPTTTTTLPPPLGMTFYLSPTGNDADDGTSIATAWRTFGRVLNASKPLQPGDTLVLLDGTYTRTTTGLPKVSCTSSGTARNGEPGRPITIRALNERQAHLQSDGLAASFEMSNCSWWVVEGLRASNTDNPSGAQSQGYPFRFAQVANVAAFRLLGSHNNRMHNTHVFTVEVSQNVLLEECEAYYFHRHAFSLYRSRFVTLRRNYANSMLYGLKGCCSSTDNRHYGDEAVSLYGTSDSIVENCVSENRANGYQIHGNDNPLDPSGHGGRNNRILGSITYDDAVPALVASRGSSGTYHNASGNLFQNFLAAAGNGHGISLRAAADNVLENVTLYGSTANSGLAADAGGSGNGATCSTTPVCPSTGEACLPNGSCGGGEVCMQNPEGCSFSARNTLAINNFLYGFRETSQVGWLIEHSNAFGNANNYDTSEPLGDTLGNVQLSMSTAPTDVGMGAGQCIAWIPGASNMAHAGADGGPIGANILFRYENGSETTEPLWDPATRAFPCGAVVPDVNDGPIRCTNIHERLGITGSGCPLPPGYGG